MKDLKKKDEEKELLAKATNDLESFIIDAQDKLWQVGLPEAWDGVTGVGRKGQEGMA